MVIYSKELNKRILIEKGLVKPLLKGDDVHRYETLNADKVVIFPYYILNVSKITTQRYIGLSYFLFIEQN
jgi:hypothetical protein